VRPAAGLDVSETKNALIDSNENEFLNDRRYNSRVTDYANK